MSGCLRRLVAIGIFSLIAIPYVHATPGLESALTRRLQDAARDSERAPALVADESLSRAARRHAGDIAKDETRAARSRVRDALSREGLADAQLIPFATVGSTAAIAKAALSFAERSVRGRGMTHVGLASRTLDKKRSVLVAIFARRLIEVAPLPRKVKGSQFRVRGRLAEKALEPSAFVTIPSGEVETLAVAFERGALAIDVPLRHGAGRYTIEILARTELGPEVVALWTFFSGIPPVAIRASQDPIASREELALQIDRLRRGYERGPLIQDAALDRAAGAHAASVCERSIAAHVLPGGSTPEARAKAAGYSGPIAENVAIAESLSEASYNLLESPSHRKNRLDPRASRIGIGIATVEPKVTCLVELYGLSQ